MRVFNRKAAAGKPSGRIDKNGENGRAGSGPVEAGSPETAGRAQASGRARKSGHARLPLPLLIAIDIVLVGVGLVTYSLFHHVLPRDVGLAGTPLPSVTIGTTGTSTGTSSGPGSGTTSGTTVPEGAFSGRFPDRFTTGAVERTETSYRSAHVSISLSRVENGSLAYTVADIYVRDLRFLRTAFATGQYGRGRTDSVLDMATESGAVVAMTGDFYGVRDRGVVIRNGVLYRDRPFEDVLVLNHDGTMQTFTAEAFDIREVVARGAWQAWSFGPMLLEDGQPMTRFNSTVTRANPRAAIGYFEPGHYCFVLVDGRRPGYSDGLTMSELSQLMHDLGCSVAYNLDGGQSAVLVFQGAVFNRPYMGGRGVSDIVCIVDA